MLRRLPASLLLLLSLQIVIVHASPLLPPLSTVESRSLSFPSHPPATLTTATVDLLLAPLLIARDADSDAQDHGIPITRSSATTALLLAAGQPSSMATAVVDPFEDSSSDRSSSSSSSRLSASLIAVIAGLVSLVFALALFALYRSQQLKNRRRDLSLPSPIPNPHHSSHQHHRSHRGGEEAPTTRTGSLNQGDADRLGEAEEVGSLKVKRAGSCSSEGTMVEKDSEGLGIEEVMMPELKKVESGSG